MKNFTVKKTGPNTYSVTEESICYYDGEPTWWVITQLAITLGLPALFVLWVWLG